VTAAPAASRRVNAIEVAGVTASLKAAVTLVVTETSVVPSAGFWAVTRGAEVSGPVEVVKTTSTK
jgi:hypothetical protein